MCFCLLYKVWKLFYRYIRTLIQCYLLGCVDLESFERQFTFIEEEIEIRIMSIKDNFTRLKQRLLDYIDKFQVDRRNSPGKDSSLRIITMRRPFNIVIRKDIGWVKLLPQRYISGYLLFICIYSIIVVKTY